MSLKKNIITWSKRVILLTGIVLWFMMATSAARKQQSLGCQEDISIRIDSKSGVSFVREQQVFRLITENYGRPIQGEALASLDLSTIERITETIPQVQKADAHVDMHGQLTLNITQKQPLVRVLHNDGVSYYIDKQGGMLPLSDNFTARVPVISGALAPLQEGQSINDNSLWRPLYSFMQTTTSDRFVNSLLEQVHREASGELLLIPKLGDVIIRFGKLENVEVKLEKLRAFYERSIADINLNKFESIDLRFDGQVVCKKREL